MATQLELQTRRMEAVEMLRAGYSQADVAFRFGVSKGAVSQWRKKWKEEGKRSLRATPHQGPRPKLDQNQQAELVRQLDQGAIHAGFETDDWTCVKVQKLIRDYFDVDYHVDHLGKLLRKLGFTPQRPKRQGQRRDAKSISTWWRKAWPRIKKGP